MAKMTIAKRTRSAIWNNGAMAFKIDFSTTWRPFFFGWKKKQQFNREYLAFENIQFLLGMPETSFNGRRTRTARSVRRLNEVFLLILIVIKLKLIKQKREKNRVMKRILCNLHTLLQRRQNPWHSKDFVDMNRYVKQIPMRWFSKQLQNKRFQ